MRISFDSPGSELSYEIELHNDPGDNVGMYFAPAFGSVDGEHFYLGFQTNMMRPGVGRVGKGIIFSRWNSLDPNDTRIPLRDLSKLGRTRASL